MFEADVFARACIPLAGLLSSYGSNPFDAFLTAELQYDVDTMARLKARQSAMPYRKEMVRNNWDNLSSVMGAITCRITLLDEDIAEKSSPAQIVIEKNNNFNDLSILKINL